MAEFDTFEQKILAEWEAAYPPKRFDDKGLFVVSFFTVKALLVENVLLKQCGCTNGLNMVLNLGLAPFSKLTEHNVSVLLQDHIGMVVFFEARKRKSRSPDIFK